jgi:hypothetical protein
MDVTEKSQDPIPYTLSVSCSGKNDSASWTQPRITPRMRSSLAVEALIRVKTPGNTRIERNARLCRLCGYISNAVEDVHRALFCCKGHLRLLSLRNEFFRNMPDANQNLLPVATDNMAWDHLISSWADELDSAIPLSRLAWHVSRLFYGHAILMPALPPMTVDPVIIDWDPASDYSSEDDAAMPTESVES